ncbi:MAG TPA: peptide deformylase [Dongiaceae bacterium]|jgi:peptide deformylase
MAILKIARMGHPVLRAPAEPVSDPKSQEIQQLVRDMMETLEDVGGIGLAAPQVHVSKRVVIFYVPGDRRAAAGEPAEDIPLTVLINPEIEPLSDDKAPGVEACLSVPGLAGQVPRWTHIRYRALDLQGRMFEHEARGYSARVVQHECDHLDGILYPMRMTDLSSLAFVEELRRFSGGQNVEEE